MKKKSFAWLRWIAVLPAAILGFAVAYLFSILFGYLNFSDHSFYRVLMIFLSNGIGGAGWTLAGALTAPSKKRLISVILSTIGCCLVVGSLVFAYFTGTPTWQIVVGDILTFIGLIAGAYVVYNMYDEFDIEKNR